MPAGAAEVVPGADERGRIDDLIFAFSETLAFITDMGNFDTSSIQYAYERRGLKHDAQSCYTAAIHEAVFVLLMKTIPPPRNLGVALQLHGFLEDQLDSSWPETCDSIQKILIEIRSTYQTF